MYFSPPRFFQLRIFLVAPFFYKLLPLFQMHLTKLTKICDACTWVGLALRLRSSTCINDIYIIYIFGLKMKGILHISCISLFDHIYNRLRSYYGIVSGIMIKSLFQEGLVTCLDLSNWSQSMIGYFWKCLTLAIWVQHLKQHFPI